MLRSEITAKIESYHSFIEEKLKLDLSDTEKAVQRCQEEKQHWQDAKLNIKILRLFREKCPTEDLTIDVPLAEWNHNAIMASAEVINYNQIHVNIGCGIRLTMYLDEADKYIDMRIRAIDRQIKHYMNLATDIKTHIKLTLLAINELIEKPTT